MRSRSTILAFLGVIVALIAVYFNIRPAARSLFSAFRSAPITTPTAIATKRNMATNRGQVYFLSHGVSIEDRTEYWVSSVTKICD